MIHFEKLPTWDELKTALNITDPVALSIMRPIFASSWGHRGVKGVTLRVDRAWMTGRDYYLKRAVMLKIETVPGRGRVFTFDDNSFRAKVAELLPVKAESEAYAKEVAEDRNRTAALTDAIVKRVNAASPSGAVHGTEREWMLPKEEKPVYSDRFRVTEIDLDREGVPTFRLEIRNLTEEQLVKLLRLSTSLKEVPR
jgi:hypothetical protein